MTQGAFHLEAQLDDYLGKPGQSDAVRVNARNYDGQPVAGVSGQAEMSLRHLGSQQGNLHAYDNGPLANR